MQDLKTPDLIAPTVCLGLAVLHCYCHIIGTLGDPSGRFVVVCMKGLSAR